MYNICGYVYVYIYIYIYLHLQFGYQDLTLSHDELNSNDIFRSKCETASRISIITTGQDKI